MSTPGWSTISGRVIKGTYCKKTHQKKIQIQTHENKVEDMAPTKLLHTLLVRFIQEEVALFHSTMYLKTQAQTGIFHQLRVDVMDQGLYHTGYNLTPNTNLISMKTSAGHNVCITSPPAWCCLGLTGAYPPFSFENLYGKS